MRCRHLDSVKTHRPNTQGSEERLATGDTCYVDELAMELEP